MPLKNAAQYVDSLNALNLPLQDIKALSFCGSKPKQLQMWLDSLPSVQLEQTSILFYKQLPEINRLIAGSSQRLALLNILRPYAQHCIDGLAEEFLKQPLSLSEKTSKIAVLAQSMQRSLFDGYLITARQILESEKYTKANSQELLQSLYFAAQCIGEFLYRSSQLYVPSPPTVWGKLNTIYQIANTAKMDSKEIEDQALQTRACGSIKEVYLRAILLACSNTNKLRPIDINHLHASFERWSKITGLMPACNNREHLYWINIESDQGPCYQSHFKALTDNDTSMDKLLAVDISGILDATREDTRHYDMENVPEHLRKPLLTHLNNSWSQQHKRSASRQAKNIELEIHVGIKAAQQQLLGNISFDDFLSQNTLKQELDLGSTVGDLKLFAETFVHEQGYQNENCSVVTTTDISEGGYCLKWNQTAPAQVKSGEIILLRRPETTEWEVATIRWAQRFNRHTYVGVQVLPGLAEAAAISTTLKSGDQTPFFRSILLKQHHSQKVSSIITPTVPFAVQQHIQLQTMDTCAEAKLEHLLMSSGSIAQFSYHPI